MVVIRYSSKAAIPPSLNPGPFPATAKPIHSVRIQNITDSFSKNSRWNSRIFPNGYQLEMQIQIPN
jgi:hypothetical protein